MSDVPQNSTGDAVVTPTYISTWSEFFSGRNVAMNNGTGFQPVASNAWSTANAAMYIPLFLPWPYFVTKMGWFNSNIGPINVDIGIYTASGIRIFSSGSTAQSGSSGQLQTVSVNRKLGPGLYFGAFAASSTTSTRLYLQNAGASTLRLAGCYQQGSALPLPATATFAVVSSVVQYPLLVITRT